MFFSECSKNNNTKKSNNNLEVVSQWADCEDGYIWINVLTLNVCIQSTSNLIHFKHPCAI